MNKRVTANKVKVGFQFRYLAWITLFSASSLMSCSTIATTVGDFKTNNTVFSGVRHSSKNLYELAHTPVKELPLRGPSMFMLLFIDLPISLVADVIILPGTIPYTLMKSGSEADEPEVSEPGNIISPESSASD